MEIFDKYSEFYSFGLGAGIVWYLYLTFCLYIIAKRLKRSDAWLAFIPIINIFYFISLSGNFGCQLIFLFIPFLNIIFMFFVWVDICHKLGKSGLWAIFTLFPPGTIILTTYLAFF